MGGRGFPVCGGGGIVQFVSGTHHWSTDAVEPRRALSYWVDTVCDRFLELDIDTPVRTGFQAQLDQTELGPAIVNMIRADVQRVRRTSAKIARTRQSAFMLMQLRAGRVLVRQAGRSTPLYPGECVLIDGRAPYEVECPLPTCSLVLTLPEVWLRRYLEHPEALVPLRVAGGGWGAALCAAVGSLEIDGCDNLALPPEEVAGHVAALLKLAIAPEPAGAAPRPLRERVVRALNGRYAEPDLSPAALAGELHMSVRSLHYTFAAAGTTFIEELMRIRLERARELLADGRARELPIAEIAARCGFIDPSHFARRFRRRFGCTPHGYRHRTVS